MLSVKLAATPAPGTVISGKYRVERLLGSGGMGAVVAATHLELNQPVAIKVLLPSAAKSEESTARFLREGRAAARLTSPFVAKVFDSGRLPTGAPYLVLELLRGRDLRSHLAEVGRVPLAQAADWALQAAHALAEAHAHQIIHRDVKPANLFLADTSGGQLIKVLDFGVSKQLDIRESDLTNTASVVGTPRYMAPEQMRSARLVDARCDVWSLGVVLYELTTGEPPFRGDSVTALCFDVMERTPTRPSELAPELPAAFDALIARCLAKDPDERLPSMDALVEALRPLASEGRASLPYLVPPTAPSQPGIGPAREPRTSYPDGARPAASHSAIAAAQPKVGPPAPPERFSLETLRSWDTSGAPATSTGRRPRLPLLALGFGAGLAITAIVSVTVLGILPRVAAQRRAGAATALPASSGSAGQTSVSPPAGASPGADARTTALVTPASAPGPADVRSAEIEEGAASSRVVAASAAPKAHSTGVAAPPPCQPPYWVDKNGHRQAKPWCQ